MLMNISIVILKNRNLRTLKIQIIKKAELQWRLQCLSLHLSEQIVYSKLDANKQNKGGASVAQR